MTGGLYVGIDPGVSGAVAFYDTSPKPQVRRITVWDLPTNKRRVGAVNRSQLDERRLANLLAAQIGRSWPESGDISVAIEQVGPRPAQDPATAATFMIAYGIIRGVVAGLGYPIELMDTSVWRTRAGMPARRSDTKGQDSLARARELFPELGASLTRQSDHNRAEAALIAYATAHGG